MLFFAAKPAPPRVYPQKFRTFYSSNDDHLPSTLKMRKFPLPAITATARASDGAIWIGSEQGLARYDARADPVDQIQYFASLRYLPDDHVLAITPDSGGGVWARTSTAAAHLEIKPMTLAAKADYFEQRVLARHDRHGLVSSSRLTRPGDLTSNQLEASDNDGLWTAIYAAAECFQYAVTMTKDALARAERFTRAVLFLEHVTGRPGFPARSFVLKGEARPEDGVWHDSADGKYVWKGDTSSDEIVGHLFLYAIAYDLLPDPVLKAEIRATTRRILDHIIEHGYNLTDVNGQPTTWGKWSRDYFDSKPGKPDSPLNALELLSFLKSGAHITGDAKYEREYRKVAIDLGYARIAAQYKELDDELNYSDEELAMLPFYSLLRYEHDPELLAVYRSALDQWWLNMQREKNPLWTYIYASGRPGGKVDFEGALWTLARIPMDTIEWTVKNSERGDVTLDGGPDRFNQAQSKTLLPPDERPVMKWNTNPFVVDGGNGGQSEDDGGFFLLPYWMGRYLGMVGK